MGLLVLHIIHVRSIAGVLRREQGRELGGVARGLILTSLVWHSCGAVQVTFGEGTANMLLRRECHDTGRACDIVSADKLEDIVFGERALPLLRRRSAVAAGLGGALAQGAKGAGRGASRCVGGRSEMEYVGVGMRSSVDIRFGVVGSRLDTDSWYCRFSAVRFMRRRSSTTMANFGCSCVAADSLLFAPKFFNACGIVDHRCFTFFSGLLFSSNCSKTS